MVLVVKTQTVFATWGWAQPESVINLWITERKEAMEGDEWTQKSFTNIYGSKLDNMEVLKWWMHVIFGDGIWKFHRVVLRTIARSMKINCYYQQEFLCVLKIICEWRKFQFCVTLKNIWSPSDWVIRAQVIEPHLVLKCWGDGEI